MSSPLEFSNGTDMVKIYTTQVRGRPVHQVLLGFNEPDREKQANLTVEDALDGWPKLEPAKMRLGSPSPAGGSARPGGWLDRFMAGARERGFRVDFACVHWYGENYDPGHRDQRSERVSEYLIAVHERCKKPVWLTEFALLKHNKGASATVAEQHAFMVKAMAMLDTLPYVERYSWFVFGSNKKEAPHTWFLLAPDGHLSELGKTYSAGLSVKQ